VAGADRDYGWILKLILLTGCRRAEIGDLKWSEIDFEARTPTLPRERTKNHQQHNLPLSEPAMEILNSIPRRDGREYMFGRIESTGFTNWGRIQRRLRQDREPERIVGSTRSTSYGAHRPGQAWRSTTYCRSGIEPPAAEANPHLRSQYLCCREARRAR